MRARGQPEMTKCIVLRGRDGYSAAPEGGVSQILAFIDTKTKLYNTSHFLDPAPTRYAQATFSKSPHLRACPGGRLQDAMRVAGGLGARQS